MAGMDLKMRRNDRGMSLFWMILVCGVAVLVLIAVLIAASEVDHVEEAGAVHIEAAGSEEDAQATANVGEGQVAQDGPAETGEANAVDVEITPTPEGAEQPVASEVDEQAVVPEAGEEPVGNESNEAGGGDPTALTPAGPEGRDDETILDDEINPGGDMMDVGEEVEVTQ